MSFSVPPEHAFTIFFLPALSEATGLLHCILDLLAIGFVFNNEGRHGEHPP
jgi:hypothetical protein